MSTPALLTAPGPSTASQGKKCTHNSDPQEPAGETDSCKSSVPPPLPCQLKKNCTVGNPETSGGPVSPQGSDWEAQASKMKKPPTSCVVYHVFCKDIEEGTGGVAQVKVALQAHKYLTSKSSSYQLFTLGTPDRKLVTINPSSEFVCAQLMLLWEECLHSSAGSIGAKIFAIPEIQKCLIFAWLASISLTSFHPDFLGPTSSTWNDLHESIALQTFEQACMNCAYETFGVEMQHVCNTELIIALYCNFVYHHLVHNIHKEQKTPGAVKQSLEVANVYKWQKHRQDEHIKYLQMKKWNPCIASIIELPVCHSDDEDSPDKSCYYCLTLSLCSANARSFVESIDTYCDSMEIPWKPHPTQKPSHFNKLPGPEVALDWFDPAQFNALLPHVHYHYCNSSIALPLPGSSDTNDWQKLKNPEEMKENAGDEDDDEVDWDANDEEQEEENSMQE
ncbi:hypothetical protein GYMLUDRAFT_239422 [Collybiopsis luxurians FD-317 M1]|nr:hypothetical protein GYMLUDRAFT_239422 [Collybiopsis luxurians FD-317 M1]